MLLSAALSGSACFKPPPAVLHSRRFKHIQQEKKLHELFIHPAIQAGLIPFITALITAELFQRIRLMALPSLPDLPPRYILPPTSVLPH